MTGLATGPVSLVRRPPPKILSRRTHPLFNIYTQPCKLKPSTTRRAIHTTSPLHGGQAASFPKLHRRTHLATRLERARQEHLMLGDAKAMSSDINERQRSGKLPDDIGLLKGTLVWPTGGAEAKPPYSDALEPYPWMGSGFITRWKLEARRAYKRFRDVITVLVAERPKRYSLPKPKFRMTKVIAKDLHRDMYTAYARGRPEDLQKIHDITCETLREDLKNRVLLRPRGVSYEWTPHAYLETKVVSHRSAVIPIGEDGDDENTTSVRQAIVRIKSLQSLVRHVEETEIEEGEQKSMSEAELEEQEELQRDVQNVLITEYLVIQKMKLRGVEGNWKVWGNTDETQNLEEAFNEGAQTTSITA